MILMGIIGLMLVLIGMAILGYRNTSTSCTVVVCWCLIIVGMFTLTMKNFLNGWDQSIEAVATTHIPMLISEGYMTIDTNKIVHVKMVDYEKLTDDTRPLFDYLRKYLKNDISD